MYLLYLTHWVARLKFFFVIKYGIHPFVHPSIHIKWGLSCLATRVRVTMPRNLDTNTRHQFINPRWHPLMQEVTNASGHHCEWSDTDDLFRHALYNLYLCDLDLIENAALEDGTVRGLEHLYSFLLFLRKEILLFIDYQYIKTYPE